MRYLEKKQARYSRVGDDMLISSNHLLHDVERVVTVGLKKSGLKTNKRKQNINTHPTQSGEKVLGVVIGGTISIARDYRRLVKAILHNAAKTGLAAQNRDSKSHPARSTSSYKDGK